MAQGNVAITAGSGTPIDVWVTATNAYNRQGMVIADPSTDAAASSVKNSAAADSEYGLTIRQAGIPAAAAMGDGAANPTTIKISSYNNIWNGTTWDRLLEAANSLNSVGTGIPTAQIVGQFDDVSPGSTTENQFGNIRMSVRRELYGQIRDAAGNERGANITSRNSLLIEGPTASGSSVAAAPVTIGARAYTALPTAVADAQVVNFATDKYGRVVVVGGTIRDLVGTQSTTISASTTETTVVTAAASVFNDLILLLISNTSATAARIDIRDTTAGSILGSIYVPAGDMRGFSMGGKAIPQTTVNTNWTAQSSASVTDLRVYAVFEKNR